LSSSSSSSSSDRMAYMMPQAPIMAQPVVAQPVIMTAPEAKRDGPNMGNKQNVYVWVSDECGCCNDCCICESIDVKKSFFTFIILVTFFYVFLTFFILLNVFYF